MTQNHAVPEEGEQALVPGDDSNDDPTPPLPAEEEDRRAPGPSSPSARGRERPELASERDIPPDGTDPLGETMIKKPGSAPQTSARTATGRT
jgi:hypothetical protein